MKKHKSSGIFAVLAVIILFILLKDPLLLLYFIVGGAIGMAGAMFISWGINQLVELTVAHWFFRDMWMKRGNLVMAILAFAYFLAYAFLAHQGYITLDTPFFAIAGFTVFPGFLAGIGLRVSRMSH